MDSAVFDSVWLPHQAAFYRLAFYILENEDEARDAVQDLYLKLWDKREQLDSIDNPKAYGLHLLRNCCIDRIRSRTRHRQTALDELSAGTEESPEEGLGRREEILLLRKAMEKLPEKQKKLLEMRVFQEMEYARISELTGLSQVNVRVSLTLARKNLRNEMEKARRYEEA